jgi:hypothetical protein
MGGGTGGGPGGGSAGASARWEQQVLTVNDASQADIVAISGSATALYAITNVGRLLLSTDGVTFTTAVASLRTIPSSLLVTADGVVFTVSNTTLERCVPPCASMASFATFPIPVTSGERFLGLCGTSSTDLLLVGNGPPPSSPALWTRFTGTAPLAPQSIGLELVNGCSAESSQRLWVTGTGRVAGVALSPGLSFTPQGFMLSSAGIDPATQRWFGSTTIAGTTFVVGSGERIMQRTGTTWTLPVNVGSAHWLRGVAGTSATRVVAAGDRGCVSCASLLWDFDGTTWRSLPEGVVGLEAVRTVVAVGEFIYVGGRQSGSRPGIVRLAPR